MLTTKTIRHQGKDLVATELNVAQIDQVLGDLTEMGALDRYYATVYEGDITAMMVELSTGLDKDAQGKCDSDELDAVVQDVIEVNSRFLSRIKALATAREASKAAPGKS